MDPEEYAAPPVELAVGTVTAAAGDEPAASAFQDVRAVLWLPDPEQRHGWREFYVKRTPEPKPGGRLGFR